MGPLRCSWIPKQSTKVARQSCACCDANRQFRPQASASRNSYRRFNATVEASGACLLQPQAGNTRGRECGTITSKGIAVHSYGGSNSVPPPSAKDYVDHLGYLNLTWPCFIACRSTSRIIAPTHLLSHNTRPSRHRQSATLVAVRRRRDRWGAPSGKHRRRRFWSSAQFGILRASAVKFERAGATWIGVCEIQC